MSYCSQLPVDSLLYRIVLASDHKCGQVFLRSKSYTNNVDELLQTQVPPHIPQSINNQLQHKFNINGENIWISN